MSIPTPNFDMVMNEMASQLSRQLQVNLLMKYKYAPGFTNKGTIYGMAPKVASSALIDSISVTYNTGSKSLEVEMLDYWKYVNDGRRPGKYAPLSSILSWISQKGLKGRDKKGRFITKESFAWGINTNIKKFGIAPTFFADNAEAKVAQEFEERIGEALNQDYENYFSSIIGQ